MKNNKPFQQIAPAVPEMIVEIKKCPSMGFIFFKAFLISPFRSNLIKDKAIIKKTRIVLKNYRRIKSGLKITGQCVVFQKTNPM